MQNFDLFTTYSSKKLVGIFPLPSFTIYTYVERKSINREKTFSSFWLRYVPIGSLHGVLQLTPGLGEHVGWYRAALLVLNNRGVKYCN